MVRSRFQLNCSAFVCRTKVKKTKQTEKTTRHRFSAVSLADPWHVSDLWVPADALQTDPTDAGADWGFDIIISGSGCLLVFTVCAGALTRLSPRSVCFDMEKCLSRWAHFQSEICSAWLWVVLSVEPDASSAALMQVRRATVSHYTFSLVISRQSPVMYINGAVLLCGTRF